MPGGVFVFLWKKKIGNRSGQWGQHALELAMACMLLVCFYILSREAALTVGNMQESPAILVDAGHGGVDPGMVGMGGLEEKGLNLAIAKKLEEVLKSKGYRVIMTRETDKGLYEEGARNKKRQDMGRRIALIEKEKPALTVSIHQNSYRDASVKGPQVFYYAESVEGARLAKLLQEKMNTGLSIQRPRQAKENKSYYLLKKSPGVVNIVECGFLTNPGEAELLQQEEYQQKIAEAIAEGIASYLGE